jgi:hypothetical protein
VQQQEVESNLYLNNKCQDLIFSREKNEQQMLAKVLVCDRGNLWRALVNIYCLCLFPDLFCSTDDGVIAEKLMLIKMQYII